MFCYIAIDTNTNIFTCCEHSERSIQVSLPKAPCDHLPDFFLPNLWPSSPTISRCPWINVQMHCWSTLSPHNGQPNASPQGTFLTSFQRHSWTGLWFFSSPRNLRLWVRVEARRPHRRSTCPGHLGLLSIRTCTFWTLSSPISYIPFLLDCGQLLPMANLRVWWIS